MTASSSDTALPLGRRDVIAGLIATGAAPAALAAAPRTGGASARLHALLDAIIAEDLQAAPELATFYGLDTARLRELRRHLNRRSPAAASDAKRRLRDQVDRLNRVDRGALNGSDRVHLDAIRTTYAFKDEFAHRFQYGAATEPRPYIVSHLTGAYTSVPELLDAKHAVASAADAEAYLERLEEFGQVLLEEIECIRHDAALGVTPPDFVQDLAVSQLRALRDQRPEDSSLVTGIARKASVAGLASDYAARASRIVTEKVSPAFDAQIVALSTLRASASHDAGVWRLPDGDQYYANSLRIETTSTQTAADLHRLGLHLVSELAAQLKSMLAAQGYARETLAASVIALLIDPKYSYPNTDAGRAKFVGDLTVKLADVRHRLPRFFYDVPDTQVAIRRVPGFLESGAPFAQYEDPSIDGTRPGTFYVNLRDMRETPSWMFTTTAFHEALPGHHLQQIVLQEGPPTPLIRKIVWSSGYGEGWGLYAEQLADELGMYENDPIGRIGYVISAMLRAGRLVVDTGIHAYRWPRDQAIAWLVDNAAIPRSLATNEVERYCVWPGQACSYMVGKTTWIGLRERARQALGRRFDIRDFHRATLAVGAVPLTTLGGVVDDYINNALRPS